MNNTTYKSMMLLMLAFGAAFFFALMMRDAKSHEAPMGWRYGWECCSSLDCRQVKDGEIRETREGYQLVTTGEVVPYSDRRLKFSQDGYFHVCQQGGNFDSGSIICIYVPPRSY